MKPEETIDFHIRWTWAKISKAYNSEAAKNGGTMSIGYVLLNIEKDGTPSTRLGPKMGMEPTSLTRILKSMEDMKLIKRVADKSDKRVVRVHLTNKGSQMREVSKKAVLSFNEEVRSRISPKKIDTFMEVMKEINEILEKNVFEKNSHEKNH